MTLATESRCQVMVHVAPWTRKRIQNIQQPKEKCDDNGSIVDAIIREIIGGGNFL